MLESGLQITSGLTTPCHLFPSKLSDLEAPRVEASRLDHPQTHPTPPTLLLGLGSPHPHLYAFLLESPLQMPSQQAL